MEGPKHLKEIFHPVNDDNTEGEIICSCGCRNFKIEYFGERLNSENDDCPIIPVDEFNGKYALVVKAICENCGERWLLFDFAKHGYDGLICGDGVSVDDSMLKAFANDQEDTFQIKMMIEVDSEEQFLEEIVNDPPENMTFTPDDRYDIWSWVVIELKGTKSGEIINLVDEELA